MLIVLRMAGRIIQRGLEVLHRPLQEVAGEQESLLPMAIVSIPRSNILVLLQQEIAVTTTLWVLRCRCRGRIIARILEEALKFATKVAR